MSEIRRAINFDLSEDLLKKYYNKERSNAWKEIRKFMESNGFSHRQKSGYVSNKPLGDTEVSILIGKLWDKCPWLEKCAIKVDLTNIGDTFDLLSIRYAEKVINKTQPQSLADKIKSAQQKADKANQETADKNIQPKRNKGQEL